MPDSATFNHAARVLATVARDLPADAALRRYLYGAKRLGAGEKRAVSRAVRLFSVAAMARLESVVTKAARAVRGAAGALHSG
jgi:hypothetical protein